MCNAGATNQYLLGMGQGIANQRGTTITSSTVDRKPGKLADFMFRGGRARGVDLNKQIPSSKESTPPVQRNAPSSSSGSTSLGIRRGSGSAVKQSISSGRSRSKSQRFSTR